SLVPPARERPRGRQASSPRLHHVEGMSDTRFSADVRINLRFLEIARDPRIIPGVHHYCDEWCDHCVLTARCLAYRCTKEHRRAHGRGGVEPTFRSMEEAVQFTRELSAIEGVPVDELEMLLAGGHPATSLQTHPLPALAWEYAIRAERLLASVPAAA